MELTNEFTVSVPVDDAWRVLTDVERIAPCLPGAELQEIAGEEYRGLVKVKVGPITAQYKGAARFLEKDDAAHRAVLKAEGRDTRGQGNASATITATLEPSGEGTSVRVVTDLTVTGKVAQFGRGVLADVSVKLLGQFVDCLEHDLLSGATSAPEAPEAPAPPASDEEPAWSAAPAAPPAADEVAPSSNGHAAGAATATITDAPPSTEQVASEEQGEPVRRIQSKPAEPVDLLEAAGVPVAKRAVPIVAGVLVILWFLRRRRRRRRA